MGDINFVDNPEKKQPLIRKKNEAPKLKWTQPGSDDSFERKTSESRTDRGQEKLVHDQAGLSSLTEDAVPEKIDKKKSGFFFFLSSLFKRKAQEKNTIDDIKSFKDEKKVLAEQSLNASREKLFRSSSDSETTDDNPEIIRGDEKTSDNIVKYSEAKKLSIRDMIKMKLKLDSMGQTATNIKTNLLQDEATIYIDWKKNGINLSLCILVAIVLIGAAYGGLMYREQRAVLAEQEIDKSIKVLSEQMEKSAQEIGEIDLFQKKLSLVTGILNKHVYWTNFFAFIEKTILDEVVYSGDFSGNTEGVYSFSATADSFQTVENQVQVLRSNKLVKKVFVDSVTFSVSGAEEGINIPMVSFTISIEVDKQLFNLSPKAFNAFFTNLNGNQNEE